MSTNDDLKKQSEDAKRDIRIAQTLNAKVKESDYANLVNEGTGKKPTEIQLQAADYWADQYIITQRDANPGISKDELAQMKASRKKDLIESGDLKELVDLMMNELKNPDEIAKRQAKDAKAEINLNNTMAKVFGSQREG